MASDQAFINNKGSVSVDTFTEATDLDITDDQLLADHDSDFDEYLRGYETLVEQIKQNKDNVDELKRLINRLSSDYTRLLDMSFDSLFVDLYKNARPALLALLNNKACHKYLVPQHNFHHRTVITTLNERLYTAFKHPVNEVEEKALAVFKAVRSEGLKTKFMAQAFKDVIKKTDKDLILNNYENIRFCLYPELGVTTKYVQEPEHRNECLLVYSNAPAVNTGLFHQIENNMLGADLECFHVATGWNAIMVKHSSKDDPLTLAYVELDGYEYLNEMNNVPTPVDLYLDGYHELKNEILAHPNDITVINSNVAQLVDQFYKVLEYDFYNFCCQLYENAPLALIALLNYKPSLRCFMKWSLCEGSVVDEYLDQLLLTALEELDSLDMHICEAPRNLILNVHNMSVKRIFLISALHDVLRNTPDLLLKQWLRNIKVQVGVGRDLYTLYNNPAAKKILLIDYTTSVNFENNYDKEMSQKLSAEVRLDLPLGSMKLLDESVVNTMVGRYEYNSFKFYYVELDPQEIEELAKILKKEKEKEKDKEQGRQKPPQGPLNQHLKAFFINLLTHLTKCYYQYGSQELIIALNFNQLKL